MTVPFANNRGGAYIFVLAAVLMMTVLVVIALTASIASRRITAYYSDFAGLYGLAAAGNEQALFLLQGALDAGHEQEEPQPLFAAAAYLFPRDWTLTVVINPAGEAARTETFSAVTTLTYMAGQFRVQTDINWSPGWGAVAYVRVFVQAYIIFLDDCTLAMVQSRRVFP